MANIALLGDAALADIALPGDDALLTDIALPGDDALLTDIALSGDDALLANIALPGDGALLADIALSGDGHSTVTAAASGDRRDTRTLRRRVRRAFCKDGTVFVSTGYGCCANQISRTPEDPFTARAEAAGQGNWCFRDTRDAR